MLFESGVKHPVMVWELNKADSTPFDYDDVP